MDLPMLQNASSTSGLPAWWGFNEDHMLLIEADERGYYPSSRSRNPSEGFISSFLQSRCKSRCRVSVLNTACTAVSCQVMLKGPLQGLSTLAQMLLQRPCRCPCTAVRVP